MGERWARIAAAGGICLVAVAACGGSETAGAPTDDVPGLGERADPVFPEVGNAGYDVRHYDWDLLVEPESGRLELTATLDAVATEALEGIRLDYAGPALSAVTLDGEDVEAEVADGKLFVPGTRAPGEDFELRAEYSGVPEPTSVDGVLGRFGWVITDSGVHTAAAFPGNTASWVPLNDTPLDPATYDISVTVPEPYVATASGTLIDVQGVNGSTTFDYRVAQPVTEVTVAVGEFVIEHLDAGEIDLDVAYPAHGAHVGVDSFADVPRFIEFLADLLGPFPFPSLGFTYIPDLTADGDSTPGRINVRSTGADNLVHELAHQWMGGIVGTASIADSWLREGLPTYAAILWLEADGRGTVDGTVALRREQLGPSTRAPLDATSPHHRVDDVVYERGALTMHALHTELGDERFREGLHRFFREHAGTSVTTEDFIATMSDTSGRDLGDLFDRWLREERLPPAEDATAER